MGLLLAFYTFIFALGLINVIKAQTEIEKPTFRILAPQFVCPKDEEALIEKPDETVVMLQTAADSKMIPNFTVRWTPLVAPTQRFTLMVWRAVRALEVRLNQPQPVPNVYVIENDQLLKGVIFEITVTATSNGVESDPKVFHIDNSQGDKKLENIEGQSDMFSINLLGSQVAYVDSDVVLEAQVTTCFPTEDYHFLWTVRSLTSMDEVDVSQMSGSRLIVPANSMTPDQSYDANCQVIRTSNNAFITQTGLHFEVRRRGLEVYMSADHLVVTVDSPFIIEAGVSSHDFNIDNVTFQWTCKFKEQPCAFFDSDNVVEIELKSGLPEVGQYEFNIKVNVKDEYGTSKITIIVIEPNLPVLQLTPSPRNLNQGTIISLTANATNVASSCSLTWYFDENKILPSSIDNVSCTEENCLHGKPITETLTIYSLEENFLNELTDFSNETEWRQINAEMVAKAGRARIVAECGCSLALGCLGQGIVYADVYYQLNVSPKAGSVLISPSTGVAMESIHRISTLAVVDPDIPLKYMFYCGLGANQTLLLAYYYEHLSVETFLPFVEGGTEVWVEVCDARGACSVGTPTRIRLGEGEGRTVTALVDAARGHLRRCELMLLQRVAVSAIVTYTNTNLAAVLSEFSSNLNVMLSGEDAEACKMKEYTQYTELVEALTVVGFYTS